MAVSAALDYFSVSVSTYVSLSSPPPPPPPLPTIYTRFLLRLACRSSLTSCLPILSLTNLPLTSLLSSCLNLLAVCLSVSAA